MKTKYIALSLAFLALASCSPQENKHESQSVTSEQESQSITSEQGGSSSSTSADVISATTHDSKLYFGSLQEQATLPFPCTFFNFSEDVPYLELSQMGDQFFNLAFGNGAAIFSVKANMLTNNLTRTSLIFDVANNKITCNDFDLFKSILGTTVIHEDNFTAANDASAQIVEDKCSRTPGKAMSWDLTRYGMKLVSYDGKIYAPFSIFETFMMTQTTRRLVFNGDDFYYASLPLMIDENGDLNEYGKAYYGGSISKKSERSESFAKYFYGTFLLQLETYNGKLPTMGIADLDAEFESKGLKTKLLSKDPKIADEAVAEAINNYFGDGGHTGFQHRGMSVSLDLEKDKELMMGILEHDERLMNNRTVMNQLNELRGQNAHHLNMSGETAIISFDEFALNAQGIAPTIANVETDYKSTFGIFYNCFKEIEKHTEIKNVVLDVSLNGGGYAQALGESLSFLTDDDIYLTTKNTLTGAINTETVAYDTDLDGDWSDKDSYAGKYNFFVLTSLYSFSCGNAFPNLVSENGWGKIIGQRSGGGDCVVGLTNGVDGTYFQMSSTSSILRKDGSNVDDGAKVDYEIDYEHFYDVEWIDQFLKEKANA